VRPFGLLCCVDDEIETLPTIGRLDRDSLTLSSLVQLIIPPNGIVFIHILGVLSILFGVFLAYAWGVIAMKAALAARPAADTAARLQLLQQAAAVQVNQTGITPADAAQRLIYDGFMLDARVTVIMYCFACVFIYFLVSIRQSAFSVLTSGRPVCARPTPKRSLRTCSDRSLSIFSSFIRL
jgi:hypothetical protein